jgi:fructokinase
MGPELVVITFGDKGLSGYRKGEKVSVDAKKVVVADTVGAGDTVGAILVDAPFFLPTESHEDGSESQCPP